MNPVVWEQAVTEFTLLLEQNDVPPKKIESFTRECFSQMKPGYQHAGKALNKLAEAIKKRHPEMESLIADIETVAHVQQVAYTRFIPQDLERMILSPKQRRGLSKTRRDEIDSEALKKLEQVIKILPMGFYPWPNRILGSQTVLNPFKQWTELSHLILRTASLEPSFPWIAKDYEKAGQSLWDPEVLGQLGKWVANQNKARLDIELDLQEDPKELDLQGVGFTLLPPQLWRQKKLQELSLKQNPLSFIPSEVLFLNQLKVLNLSGTGIKELPRPVRFLKLQALSLADSQIGTLPAWLFEMRSLVMLNLSGLRLAKLPPEIGGLHHLTDLALERNQLEDLPGELANLNLQVLYISYNHFSNPPPVIEKLHHLRTLSCHGLDASAVKLLTRAKVLTD